MNRVGIILLAAGGSRRLGYAKQLVEINGKPLVRFVADRLLELQASATCVVLGANADRIGAALSGLPVETVTNEHWSEGIGTSIALGAKHLQHRNLDCLLIALCDQPAIPLSHYHALCDRFDATSNDIVASEYDGTPGVPAVFATSLLGEMIALRGDRGAKGLMLDLARRVVRIPCDAARSDLDTAADLAAFAANQASGA